MGCRLAAERGGSATEGEPGAKGEDKASEGSSHTSKGHAPITAQARRANPSRLGSGLAVHGPRHRQTCRVAQSRTKGKG